MGCAVVILLTVVVGAGLWYSAKKGSPPPYLMGMAPIGQRPLASYLTTSVPEAGPVHDPPPLPRRRPLQERAEGIAVAAARLANARIVAGVVCSLDDPWCYIPESGDTRTSGRSGQYVRVTADPRAPDGFIVEYLSASIHQGHPVKEPFGIPLYFVSAGDDVRSGVNQVAGVVIGENGQRSFPLPGNEVERRQLSPETADQERRRLHHMLTEARIIHDLEEV